MSFSAFTYEYNDLFHVEYMMKMNFSCIVTNIVGDTVSISVVDTSAYTENATPIDVYDTEGILQTHAYKWRVLSDDGEELYVSYRKSFNFSFKLTAKLIIEQQITTIFGTSVLKRALYFNTHPTIEALLSRTSTAINKDIGSNNYKLLSLDSLEYDLIYAKMKEVMLSGYLDYATGISLDRHGVLWNVFRDDGEGDDPYRARIKQKIASFNSSISKDKIRMLIAILYGIEETDINLLEREDIPDYSTLDPSLKPYNSDIRPAEFTYIVKSGPEIPVNMQYIDDIINKSRAVGVYYNSLKVTFLLEEEISLELKDISIYDIIAFDEDVGWGYGKYGSEGEHLITNSLKDEAWGISLWGHKWSSSGWSSSLLYAYTTFSSAETYHVICSSAGYPGYKDAYIYRTVNVYPGVGRIWGNFDWGEER